MNGARVIGAVAAVLATFAIAAPGAADNVADPLVLSATPPVDVEVAATPHANAAEAPSVGGPAIQALGTDDQRVYVVDHGGSWSMHAEAVVAGALLTAWHEAGGPLVRSKVVLDYPYTTSIHRVSAERILEGVLEGWSYTLHYAQDGRLELVRVYSAEPQRMFKTPRLVESLAAWKVLESPPPPAPDAAPPATIEPVAPVPAQPE